jgi:hypothetical protein
LLQISSSTVVFASSQLKANELAERLAKIKHIKCRIGAILLMDKIITCFKSCSRADKLLS